MDKGGRGYIIKTSLPTFLFYTFYTSIMFTISVKEFIHVIFYLLYVTFYDEIMLIFATICYLLLTYSYILSLLFPRACYQSIRGLILSLWRGKGCNDPINHLVVPCNILRRSAYLSSKLMDRRLGVWTDLFANKSRIIFINLLGEKGLEKPVTGRRPAPPRWTQNQYKSLHILEC